MDIFDILSRLSSTKRFSNAELSKPESVLEHTGFVVILSYYIANELSSEGYDVDIFDVVQKAMLHDFEEAVTGDILRPIKYANTEIKNAIKNVEKESASKIFKNISKTNSDKFYSLWENAKIGRSGKIVSFVDSLSVIHKANDEINVRHNKSIMPILSSTLIKSYKRRQIEILDEFPNSAFLKNVVNTVDNVLNFETGDKYEN